MQVTKSMLKIGNTGRQIDAEGRKLYDKGGYLRYLVCRSRIQWVSWRRKRPSSARTATTSCKRT